MNSFEESIRYLYGLQKLGMKFGLQGIRSLLKSVGDPHRRFKSIHIAGTNGKGSTASMLAAILTAAGYRTGLYTSPHLVSYIERIRINGKPIPEGDVVASTKTLRSTIDKHQNTFFEATTAIAFKYFADEGVDIAVIETGLGGRLDATNVVHPVLSIITTVGLEHTEILGDTIAKIAAEKAGIIKREIPCLVGVNSQSALKVIKRICREKKAPFLTHDLGRIVIGSESLYGTRASFTLGKRRYDDVALSLIGRHQTKNALLALLAIESLRDAGYALLTEQAVRSGLADIRRYSGINARLSQVHRNPTVFADVAHNPDAMKALVASLKRLTVGRMRIVFGVMQDKDYARMLRSLKALTRKLYLVEAKTERTRRAEDLRQECARNSLRAVSFASVREGVQAAMSEARKGEKVLITGSHFVVGEALAFLQRKKYLTINQ